MKEFIATINGNNENKTKKYIDGNYSANFLGAYPIEHHLDYANQLYRRNGKLSITSISRIPDKDQFFRLAALVNSERTEEWSDFILYFDPDKPGKISGIQNRPASLSSIPGATAHISQQKLEIELKSYMERAAEKDIFSGAVLLAKKDKIVFIGATGSANKRFGVPNNIQTKFNLGSMNKMFTAVAIMQLVESGKLDLDDYLNKFIDRSWLKPEISHKIQINHLLSHTSGLGSYFNDTYQNSAKDLFRNLDDYKVLIKDETLKFDPGTKYSYSNTGMFMLGLVIEKVSGENYFDYIRDHIYKPAGMKNSDSFDVDLPIPNLATGYYFNPDFGAGWTNNNFLLPARGCPAGGGYSTVEDLYNFSLALVQNKLLQKTSTANLFVARSEPGAVNYGYGFEIAGDKNNRIVGHSGMFDGVSGNLDVYLDQGYIAIVLSNYSGGALPFVQKMRLLVSQLTKEK